MFGRSQSAIAAMGAPVRTSRSTGHSCHCTRPPRSPSTCTLIAMSKAALAPPQRGRPPDSRKTGTESLTRPGTGAMARPHPAYEGVSSHLSARRRWLVNAIGARPGPMNIARPAFPFTGSSGCERRPVREQRLNRRSHTTRTTGLSHGRSDGRRGALCAPWLSLLPVQRRQRGPPGVIPHRDCRDRPLTHRPDAVGERHNDPAASHMTARRGDDVRQRASRHGNLPERGAGTTRSPRPHRRPLGIRPGRRGHQRPCRKIDSPGTKRCGLRLPLLPLPPNRSRPPPNSYHRTRGRLATEVWQALGRPPRGKRQDRQGRHPVQVMTVRRNAAEMVMEFPRLWRRPVPARVRGPRARARFLQRRPALTANREPRQEATERKRALRGEKWAAASMGSGHSSIGPSPDHLICKSL